MCIYAMCVTLQKVCLLARQDAQRRVGTTPNMTADQMVEHVFGTMKKEPAAHAEKVVGPMEPADGEQKAVKKVVLKRRRKAVGEMKKAVGEKNSVKKVVLKRPSAAAPTQGAGCSCGFPNCSCGFPKCCPGVPTKKADPMRINGWTIYTDLNARAWRCKHPTSRCDKAASRKADVRVAWEKVQQIVNTEL